MPCGLEQCALTPEGVLLHPKTEHTTHTHTHARARARVQKHRQTDRHRHTHARVRTDASAHAYTVLLLMHVLIWTLTPEKGVVLHPRYDHLRHQHLAAEYIGLYGEVGVQVEDHRPLKQMTSPTLRARQHTMKGSKSLFRWPLWSPPFF